jgi:hypothetical protein
MISSDDFYLKRHDDNVWLPYGEDQPVYEEDRLVALSPGLHLRVHALASHGCLLYRGSRFNGYKATNFCLLNTYNLLHNVQHVFHQHDSSVQGNWQMEGLLYGERVYIIFKPRGKDYARLVGFRRNIRALLNP